MKRDCLNPSSFFATTQQIERWLLPLIRYLVVLGMLIAVLVWCL